MLERLDYGYIRIKNWLSVFVEEFMSDERGVSGIVATVILVLLAVLLAGIFWDKISTWVRDDLWKQVTENAKFSKE